jgi:hypothetical protein
MSNFLKLWIGIGVLVAFSVVFFFIGRGVWGDQAFAPNYAASMAGAALGGALSLIVVMISFTITRQSREKDLSYARFAFLRRRGEELWQAYIAFCQSLGVNTSNIAQATWNTVDHGLWPIGEKASELHDLLKKQTSTFSNSPGPSALSLIDAYDEVFAAVSDTGIFEGEHSIAKDITEAWRQFGWAGLKIQDYQSRIGWTPQNWPEISKSIEQASGSVCKTITCLIALANKITIK